MEIAVFIGIACFVAFVGILVTGKKRTVDARIEGLTETPATRAGNTAPHRLGTFGRTDDQSRAEVLTERIVQAGYYKKKSIRVFYVLRVFLMVAPLIVAMLAVRSGFITLTLGMVFGILAGAIGTVAPSFLLDLQKSRRQTQFRRALPDALDVIIICVEAGLSMPAALARVAKELRTAHPMLAGEMAICQRQVQMGSSTGEALRRLAQRFDLEELRSLASVIQQAERYGASIVHALRVHSDTLRQKRFTRAEEKAQQAAVKLVFPTILCIFPALLIVLAGPAVYRIFQMFEVMGS